MNESSAPTGERRSTPEQDTAVALAVQHVREAARLAHIGQVGLVAFAEMARAAWREWAQ